MQYNTNIKFVQGNFKEVFGVNRNRHGLIKMLLYVAIYWVTSSRTNQVIWFQTPISRDTRKLNHSQ